MLIPERPYQTRHHAAQKPDAVALILSATGEQVTFSELEARANQGAHLLREIGVQTGQHIAILMENRREFLEVCFAADRAGLYYTTISTHLSGDEVAYILKDCGAQMLITSSAYLHVLAPLDGGTDQMCPVYLVGSEALEPHPQGLQSWTAPAT